MTADQIAAIVGDSGFQTTIRQKYAELDTMIRRLEQLAASDPGAIYPVTGQTCGPADVTSTYTWPSGDPSSTGDPTGGGTSSDPGTPTSTLTGGGPSSPGYSSITSYPSSTGFPSSTGGPSSTGFPGSTGYPTSGKTSSRPGIPSSTLTAGVPSSMPYIPPTSTSQPGCGGTSTTASPTHS
jgi:hypothetical protein